MTDEQLDVIASLFLPDIVFRSLAIDHLERIRAELRALLPEPPSGEATGWRCPRCNNWTMAPLRYPPTGAPKGVRRKLCVPCCEATELRQRIALNPELEEKS